MKQRFFGFLNSALLAAAISIPLAAPASAETLPPKEVDGGNVMVSVSPQDLSNGAKAWRFAVQFNTHVSPIVQDLVAVSSLTSGDGAGEPPIAWEGDPPGGHHRRGVLVFKPIEPMPKTITLDIRTVGGVADRTFTWNLADSANP